MEFLHQEDPQSQTESQIHNEEGDHVSIDQISDDDEIVDNVISKISGVGKTSQRYNQDTGMNEFEFTNENIFTKGNDLF